jgi:molybdopterin/thiamine biosynthesis adenylyltransferase
VTNLIDTSKTGRFSREQLAGYKPDVMERAVVLVVGSGALAQSLIPNLALPGVGEIRVCDFDDFEPHNASRSPYFPTPEEQRKLGLMKAKVVAHKAHSQMLATNPTMRYALVPIQQLGLGAFDGVDVVISAVDNPRARAYLSDVCRYLGITLIEGGFDGPAIAMSCFPGVAADEAGARPCYRCGNPYLIGTFSCQRYAAEAEKAGFIAAIQPASATLAGLMAEATIQAIHGEHPMAFKRATLNVRTGEHRQYELTCNGKCPGIHARLTGAPSDLNSTPENRLGALLDEVENQLGVGVRIDLAEPFIVEAYCMSCGDAIIVEAPEWAYDMRPRCDNATCKGPWTSAGAAPEGYTPIKPIRIDAMAESRILDLPCSKAGFVAMNLVHAYHAETDTSAVYRIAGDLTELYAEVLP